MSGEQAVLRKPLFGSRLNMSHPLSRGLVGCWLLNETGGVQAMDLSPYGNHGLLAGFDSPPKRAFNGLAFDGIDDYIDCGNDESLDITDEITIELWVYISNQTENYGRILMKEPLNENVQFFINQLAGGFTGEVVFRDYDGSTTKAITIAGLSQDRWTHLVTTYDSVTVKVYADAVEKGSLNYVANRTAGDDLIIGGNKDTSNFKGLINGVRIWNRALSAQDIKNLYLSPHAPMGEPMYL